VCHLLFVTTADNITFDHDKSRQQKIQTRFKARLLRPQVRVYLSVVRQVCDSEACDWAPEGYVLLGEHEECEDGPLGETVVERRAHEVEEKGDAATTEFSALGQRKAPRVAVEAVAGKMTKVFYSFRHGKNIP
jgi:hypothetical protein